MKIIQIFKDGATIYGLGDDQNVYTWGYSYQSWLPTWGESTEVKVQYSQDTFRQNPAR